MLFSLTKFILMLPGAFLCAIGEPFKYTPSSNLGNKSDDTVKGEYYDAKIEHYIPRIVGAAVTVMVLIMCFIFLKYTIIALACVLGVSILVDAFFLGSRWVFFHTKDKEHQKTTGTALALTDNVWKDTSLKSVLEKAAVERGEKIKVKEAAKMRVVENG